MANIHSKLLPTQNLNAQIHPGAEDLASAVKNTKPTNNYHPHKTPISTLCWWWQLDSKTYIHQRESQNNLWRIFLTKGARKAERDTSCPLCFHKQNKAEFTGLHSSIRNNCFGVQRVSTGSRIPKGTPPTSCSTAEDDTVFSISFGLLSG